MAMLIGDRAEALHTLLRTLADRTNLKMRPVMDAGRIARLEAFRAAVRVEDGGGGHCHTVTEYMSYKAPKTFGRLGVSYLSEDGGVICSGHYVSFLADGTLIDPTADQMGEGQSVAVLNPSNRCYGRYRPEFDGDYNPDVAADLAAFSADWISKDDFVMQDVLRAERGEGWWLDDKSQYEVYWRMQARISSPDYRVHCDRVLKGLAVDAGSKFGVKETPDDPSICLRF